MPQVEYVEKIVEVPKVVTEEDEKIVEVPQVECAEEFVHVPKVETHGVEKIEEAIDDCKKKVDKLTQDLSSFQACFGELGPMMQQEVVRPLTTKVENCEKEVEALGTYLTSRVQTAEREMHNLLANTSYEK